MNFDVTNIFKIMLLFRSGANLNASDTKAYLLGQQHLLEAMAKTDAFLADAFENLLSGVKSEQKIKEEQSKTEFERNALKLNVPVDWYLKSFLYKTKWYTIVALYPSKPKNCVSLRDKNGKIFGGSVSNIKFFLS